MKQILFVNACMRGPEQSRTWRLSQAFLAACRTRWPEAVVKERDLTGCELPVLTGRRRWIPPALCSSRPGRWPRPIWW